MDPRVKCLGVFAILIAVGLARNLETIGAVYLLGLGLAILSRIPFKFFVLRVWLFMPFFTGIIALPALFVTPGPALVYLPFGLVISQTGAITALFLLMRVGTSVSMTVLFIMTTPWNSVLKGLKALFVPDVIVLILGMTYRYIYLLLHLANDMFLSRKSRLVGNLNPKDERRMVGETAGVLLSHSLQMSSEVYMAMQSRGFFRIPRTMDSAKLKPNDLIAGLLILVIAGGAVWLGR